MKLRLASCRNSNFEKCLEENLWRAREDIFKGWEIGDYLVFFVEGAIAGLSQLTGNPFQDKTRLWQNDIYPFRIPLKFLHFVLPQNRIPIDDDLKTVLINAWPTLKGKYNVGVLYQMLVPHPYDEIIYKHIFSIQNDLDRIKIKRTKDKGLDNFKNSENRVAEHYPKKSYIPQVEDLDRNDAEDDWQEEDLKILDIPDFDEPTGNSNEIKINNPIHEENPHDEEEARLLDILVGEPDRTLLEEQKSEILPPTTLEIDHSKILPYLEKELESLNFAIVEKHISELRVFIVESKGDFEMFIEYHEEQRILSIKTLFPYKEEPILDLLKLSGTNEFSSIIGVEFSGEGENIIVRKTLPLSNFITFSKIKDSVFQSIFDTEKVFRILKSN